MIEEKANELLRMISRVYKKREGLFEKEDLYEDVENEIRVFSDFLSLPEKPATVLAMIICENIMGESTPLPALMQSMGFEPADFLETNVVFKGLRKRGWLRVRQQRYSGRVQHHEATSCLMEAVLKYDSNLLKEKRAETLRDALSDLHRYIADLNSEFDSYEMCDLLVEYLDYYRDHLLLCQVMEDADLSNKDKLLLVWAFTQQIKGREDHDLEEYTQNLLSDDFEKQTLRQDIKNNTCPLFNKGYFTFPNAHFPDLTRVALGDEVLMHFQQHMVNGLTLKKSSKHYTVLIPEEIQEVPLHFNKQALPQIDELQQMVSTDNFNKLSERMREKGMKRGLTMLLYGAPGTGKTELVKQLGKQHNRPIMQVEIASVKSAWVGESEKNLQKVFKEYQDVVKRSRQIPILLFNEADALITKRLQSNSSVDQMVNTMQNILLQSLEDFEGIFIATTNLISNMDGAFDRRMLYKVRFELPDASVRYRILKQSLEFIPDALLRKISREHNLSGGQIMNLRKKLLIDDLLGSDEKTIKSKLLRYVKEETGFRTRTTSSTRPIGFVLPGKR